MRFYKELYSQSIEVIEENNKGNETLTVDKISKGEVLNALKDMTKKKSSKEDGIVTQMSQDGEDIICDLITKVFNTCLF